MRLSVGELEVHRIICPHRELELERLRIERPKAEAVILALRRLLIAQDSSLPDAYDGTAWAEIEQIV
jgi:hypothetical protein